MSESESEQRRRPVGMTARLPVDLMERFAEEQEAIAGSSRYGAARSITAYGLVLFLSLPPEERRGVEMPGTSRSQTGAAKAYLESQPGARLLRAYARLSVSDRQALLSSLESAKGAKAIAHTSREFARAAD